MHDAKLCCASGLSASSADLSFPCFHTGLCIFMGGEKTAFFPTPPFPVGCIFRKVGTSSFHAVVNTCQVWMRFSPGNELLGGDGKIESTIICLFGSGDKKQEQRCLISIVKHETRGGGCKSEGGLPQGDYY